MGPALGIIGLVVGAVGSGVSYMAQTAAADTQSQLAAANEQTTLQSIDQTRQTNQLQSSINAALATKDRDAATANASMLASQAETASSAAREGTRLSREEAARFAATQRAALAKGGFVDTTGSPLALLADTAEKEQNTANNIRFQDEDQRRALFRESALTKNQGILAGISATGQQASGIAAVQTATMQAAQSKLDLYSQQASASAARTQAVGGLFTSFGGLAGQAYTMFNPSPWRPKKLGQPMQTSYGEY